MNPRAQAHRDGARGAPWYSQFWPWFLVALPATAVAASIASLVIAVRNADSLVRSDWSAAGDAINEMLAREEEAASRGLVATLRLDPGSRQLRVELDGRAVEAVSKVGLELRHPADSDRDVALELPAQGNGLFTAMVDADLHGDWYATLSAADGSWTIRRRITLDRSGAAAVVPSE
jgi:hypothetical protein